MYRDGVNDSTAVSKTVSLGLNPSPGANAGIAKRSNVADCKSAGLGLRLVRIHLPAPCECRIVTIIPAFQAEDESLILSTRTKRISSIVEHPSYTRMTMGQNHYPLPGTLTMSISSNWLGNYLLTVETRVQISVWTPYPPLAQLARAPSLQDGSPPFKSERVDH